MNNTFEPSKDGAKLLQNWLAAEDEKTRAEFQLTRAETAAKNARNELTKWLLPHDAKPGEKIGMWYGDNKFIQVEVSSDSLRDHVLTVRTRR